MAATTAFVDEPFPTTGMVGANFHMHTDAPMFRLGTTARGTDNTDWIYVQASEAVSGTCTVTASTWALTDAAGNYTAPIAFTTTAPYGWVKLTAGAV